MKKVKKIGIFLAISMVSTLLLSGTLVVTACPFEGETPGFWKNHLDAWGPTGYSTDDLVGDYFIIPSALSELADDTLLQALKYHGGKGAIGAARILLRAAVAGLLNSAHPDVNYLYSYSGLQYLVNYPLSILDADMMILREALIDAQNNLGAEF